MKKKGTWGRKRQNSQILSLSSSSPFRPSSPEPRVREKEKRPEKEKEKDGGKKESGGEIPPISELNVRLSHFLVEKFVLFLFFLPKNSVFPK